MVVPRRFLSTLESGFSMAVQTGLETALVAGRPHSDMGSRHRLWVSITGSSTRTARRIARSSCACTSSPQSVGGPRAGKTGSKQFERFAEVRENLPDRPRLGDERGESDVAATPRALQRKLLPTLAMSVAHAIREVSWGRG